MVGWLVGFFKAVRAREGGVFTELRSTLHTLVVNATLATALAATTPAEAEKFLNSSDFNGAIALYRQIDLHL